MKETDRLAYIKNRRAFSVWEPGSQAYEDISWLIAEVEHLRGENNGLRMARDSNAAENKRARLMANAVDDDVRDLRARLAEAEAAVEDRQRFYEAAETDVVRQCPFCGEVLSRWQ